MTQEESFRRILILLSALLFPILFSYRLRSQATGESLDRRQEGWFILLTLRPIGIACMLAFILYLVNPELMAWASVPLPEIWRWIGVPLGISAGLLLVWTLRSIGTNLTDTVVTRKEHSLVVHGPYRWVRNPFYDAVALGLFANSLVTANWFIFLTGSITVVLLIVRTPREEERLLLRFGDAYQQYVARTGRFFPKL